MGGWMIQSRSPESRRRHTLSPEDGISIPESVAAITPGQPSPPEEGRKEGIIHCQRRRKDRRDDRERAGPEQRKLCCFDQSSDIHHP